MPLFPWLEPAPEEAYSPPAWKGTNARSHTDIVRYGSTTAPLRNQSPRAFRYGCSRDRVAWQTNWPHLSPFRSQAGEAGWMSSAARAARLVRQVRARAKHPPRLSCQGFLLRFGDRTDAQEPYRCPAVRVGRFPERNKAQLHRDAVCWTPNFAQRKGKTTALARHARYETASFYRTRWSQRAAPHGREERGRSGHYARSRVPRDARTQLGGRLHPSAVSLPCVHLLHRPHASDDQARRSLLSVVHLI